MLGRQEPAEVSDEGERAAAVAASVVGRGEVGCDAEMHAGESRESRPVWASQASPSPRPSSASAHRLRRVPS